MAKAPGKTGEKKETQAEYRQRIMDIVCDHISSGQTLRKICDDITGIPVPSAIYAWLSESEPLQEQYASARARQADYFADEIIDIADTVTDANLARVRIDARKWHASKTAPKKYGDKIEQTLQNPDGSKLDLTVNFVSTKAAC